MHGKWFHFQPDSPKRVKLVEQADTSGISRQLRLGSEGAFASMSVFQVAGSRLLGNLQERTSTLAT